MQALLAMPQDAAAALLQALPLERRLRVPPPLCKLYLATCHPKTLDLRSEGKGIDEECMQLLASCLPALQHCESVAMRIDLAIGPDAATSKVGDESCAVVGHWLQLKAGEYLAMCDACLSCTSRKSLLSQRSALEPLATALACMPALKHVGLAFGPLAEAAVEMLLCLADHAPPWQALELEGQAGGVDRQVSACVASVPLLLAASLPALQSLNMAGWPGTVFGVTVAAVHGHACMQRLALRRGQLVGASPVPEQLSVAVEVAEHDGGNGIIAN